MEQCAFYENHIVILVKELNQNVHIIFDALIFHKFQTNWGDDDW